MSDNRTWAQTLEAEDAVIAAYLEMPTHFVSQEWYSITACGHLANGLRVTYASSRVTCPECLRFMTGE